MGNQQLVQATSVFRRGLTAASRLHLRRARRIATATAMLSVSLVGVALSPAATYAAPETAVPPAPYSGAPSTIGTEFWGVFAANVDDSTDGIDDFVYLSDATKTTVQATVAVPGVDFTQNVTVTPGATTSVQLPTPAPDAAETDGVDDTGVHVTASGPVSVYGLEDLNFSTDGWTGLPVTGIGTSYEVLGFDSGAPNNGPSEFEVVGTKAATTVTIDPSSSTAGRTAGTPYTVSLGAGQTYQLIGEGGGDLTGTTITSSAPVSVFAGAECANIPDTTYGACNMVTEQLPPITEWGKDFLAEPLATRTLGDTWRVLAGQAGTVVTINGAVAATLAAGAYLQVQITTPSVIHTSNPALVAQFSDSTAFDGSANADPSMTIDPPYEEFLNAYTFSTAPDARFTNYVNVVAPTAEVDDVLLDGKALPATDFTPLAGTSFSGAQVPLTLGSHTLSAPQAFGATVYGFGVTDAYSYPGGYGAGLVAEATFLTLSPSEQDRAVNTQACVTATVEDQSHKPLDGIPVSFSVAGANAAAGFAPTAANGQAVFCYTGKALGSDTVTATAAGLTTTAGVEFVGSTTGVGSMWLGADGGMFAFGDRPFLGAADYVKGADFGGQPGPLTTPHGVVIPTTFSGIAETPDRLGYFDVLGNGQLFTFGDATGAGSLLGSHINSPIVGVASDATGKGYWMVGSDGGVYSFGDATFHGSMGSVRLNSPVVGITSTPDGQGYWLVAADGGIFSFGDAAFYGSTGGLRLNAAVVGMARTVDGHGYDLVAADGGVFAFGDGSYHGSTAALRLNAPVSAIALTPDGAGYWLVAQDGGAFAFGDAPYQGNLIGRTPALRGPIVGAVS